MAKMAAQFSAPLAAGIFEVWAFPSPLAIFNFFSAAGAAFAICHLPFSIFSSPQAKKKSAAPFKTALFS